MTLQFSEAPANGLGVEEFHATWRSSLGLLVGVVAILAVVAFTIGALDSGVVRVTSLLTGVLLAWFIWLLGRPLWDGQPLVRLGPDGISGRSPKPFSLRWPEVADIRVDVIQSNVQLVIRPVAASGLHPGQAPKKSWTGAFPGEKRVPLNGLPQAARLELVAAAHRRFHAHAGGQAMQAAQVQQAEYQAHNAFDARLIALTPRVWAMPAVMLVCAGVWVANVMSGMSPMQPGTEDLYRWGANATSAVQAGQYWRLLTAMFLHGGIVHLALNMYALWSAGLMVTRLFGNRGFLVVYLGAGLAGNALSLYFSAQTGVSVGASGAVFGVVGALLAAVIQHRGKFPMGRSRQLLTSLAIFIFYSLVYGFSQKGIDNAAHVGGLLAGFAAGWLLREKIDVDATGTRRNISAALAAAVCIAATAALVVFAPPARRDVAAYLSGIHKWNALQTELVQAMKALQADGAQARAGTLDNTAMARRLETVHAPAMHRLETGFAALGLPADELVGRYAQAQQRYVGAMARLMDADLQRQRAPSPELAETVQRLSAEAKQANEAIDALNAETAETKEKKR